MNIKNILKNQSGQVARLMLSLVIVCFVAIIIAYIVIRSANKPTPPPIDPGIEEVPKAIYETTINDIKITFQEAVNYGNTMRGSISNNPSYQKDLTSTEKFILVKIGAQNKGKVDTKQNIWDLGNIIDSEGRNFKPNNYSANPWLPKDNGCGDVLKPEFTPISCSKIYEVSKVSQGLKVEVLVSKKEGDDYDTSKKDTILLDLIVNDK